jgi:hypothetical protein
MQFLPCDRRHLPADHLAHDAPAARSPRGSGLHAVLPPKLTRHRLEPENITRAGPEEGRPGADAQQPGYAAAAAALHRRPAAASRELVEQPRPAANAAQRPRLRLVNPRSRSPPKTNAPSHALHHLDDLRREAGRDGLRRAEQRQRRLRIHRPAPLPHGRQLPACLRVCLFAARELAGLGSAA